jgi:hypothetical protein
MVAMIGCYKSAIDPCVRVRTRACVLGYVIYHVYHVRSFVSYCYYTFYGSIWSGAWSAHGLVCSQLSKESFNTGTKGAMVKTFGIKTRGT